MSDMRDPAFGSNDKEHTADDPLRTYVIGDHWELPSDIRIVKIAVSELEHRLRELGWDESKVFNFSISTQEGLVNAIKHGCKNAKGFALTAERTNVIAEREIGSRSDRVSMDLSLSSEEARVTIKDPGKGFDWKKVIDPTDPETVQNESGRGLFMMRELSDAVYFNEEGNQVTIVIRRN